ncbi:Zinc-finger domain of monoamine-oxidase A repressor R1 [Forsythia ovata]|uniref:Zinc-finger domain of monoamine-oxidase A repressor R1 n=1 Tax=Forsythia ovata TaxID=205694 RepID=A0ABD1U7M6_9LAMI
MVNTRGSRKIESSEEPKEENENGGGKGMVEYEESRAQRIKDNMDRMRSLGILNLSKKLKPESKRQIAKTPSHKKKPTRDDPPRRSTRLKEMPSVSYFEKSTAKKEISVKTVEIHIEEDENPETYTEEQEKLLGDCKAPWTLYVDGYDEEGQRIYDPFEGKSCHQCRQKTRGHRTECIKCKKGTGQFCGDCLYMRYGENVTEVNQNPKWICPVCRGICNCSRCRRDKGWAATGNIYRKVERLGFRSVAHYLIQTFRKKANPEEPAGENPVSGSFSIEDQKAVVDDKEDGMEDNGREQDSDEDYSGDDHSDKEDEDEDEYDS